MNKKIVAIMGSPHIQGNGASALNFILRGAERSGASCKRYDLCKLTVKNCLGCRKCLDSGICVQKDDMAQIFEDIKIADTLIIASPIYIHQVNGFTKTVLDRMYPLTDQNHKPRFGMRDVMMLCTYGIPLPFIFNPVIRRVGKSLKAMGLINRRNVIIPGCATIDKVKCDRKLQQRLIALGEKIGREMVIRE